MAIIRASSTDRILACASSAMEPEHPYNPQGAMAKEGTSNHELFSVIPLGQEPDVDEVTRRHGVDRDEAERMVWRAKRIWEEIGQWYKFPTTEAALGPVDIWTHPETGEVWQLRGTADLVSVVGKETAGILDWKSGYRQDHHVGQIKSYAWLLRERLGGMPESGFISATEAWVRMDKAYSYRFTAEDLDGHCDAIQSQLERMGRQYGPSHDACMYCPHQMSCRARADYLGAASAALAPSGETLPQVDRAYIGQTWNKYLAVKKALAHYDRVATEFLREGPIELEDGRVLELTEKQLDKIIPSKAMRVIREDLQFTPAEADVALNVTKSGIHEVMKARAAKGKGAAMARMAMGKLRDAGAIGTTTRLEKAIRRRK